MEHDAALVKKFYHYMLLCRRFEERAGQSYQQEKIHGFCHLYIGQEAVAVGSMLAARPDDYLIATYREHAHALVRDCDPTAVMAELFGKKIGMSGGYGGSMHLFDVPRRFLGGHGIVGGHAPLAIGLAFASRYEKKDTVTLCYLGDAAINQGAFHEAMNLAALWKLPVIFIIENNLYGMGTAVGRAVAGDIVKRGEMYGIPSAVVDGMDIFAMYDRTKEAVDLARRDGTPTLLEARCYRYRGHSMSDPGTYRSKEEVQREQQRDPITRLKQHMLEQRIASEDWFSAQDKEIRAQVSQAVEAADRSPEPDPAQIAAFVYA